MDPYIILSGQSKGVNRNKRNRYKSLILAIVKQINQKQLILTQEVDSKKGQLIYLTRKGSFQVILYKMIRFLSGKLKKHTKLAKIVKISIFVNRLVFPMNFNRSCHPMTKPIHVTQKLDWLTLEFCHYTWGWLWYSQVFQRNHVYCRKSVNIRSIPK